MLKICNTFRMGQIKNTKSCGGTFSSIMCYSTYIFTFYLWANLVFGCFFRAAVACIGGMYEKLGRMVGRSYEDTISLLIKALKNAEVSEVFAPPPQINTSHFWRLRNVLASVVSCKWVRRLLGKSSKTSNCLFQSQGRYEIMVTLRKVIAGLGSAGSNCYRDVYKAARNCMTDRAMTVRSAAARVFLFATATLDRFVWPCHHDFCSLF